MKTIIVTGASGFIGRYFLDNLKEDYLIYAIARRSRMEANVPYHHNIKWIQGDISNKISMYEIGDYITNSGGADYIIHLAAFYDFSYDDNPEYFRSNILGTENVLELGKQTGIKCFIFSSSIAGCKFMAQPRIVDETTPLDADFAYARSKKAGEELLKKYSVFFKCCSVRCAAVFSDWCEYAPLYKFLDTWLSKSFDSKIIAGRGKSAIAYIHINDLLSITQKIMTKCDVLPDFNIFMASPNGSTSHLELFQISTQYYFGKTVKPFLLPKKLALPGLLTKIFLSKIHCYFDEPFEKIWMVNYIDLVLNSNSSQTQRILDWKPTSRNVVNRRLLFLIEKMKNHRDEWALKNEAALKKVARRANILIYEALMSSKDANMQMITNKIRFSKDKLFKRYQLLNDEDFHCYTSTLYHLLMATIRSNDRNLILDYIDDIAIRRFAEGFLPEEVCATLQTYKDVIIEELLKNRDLMHFNIQIYDNIGLTLQLAQDEVEDMYGKLIIKMPIDKISESDLVPDCEELKRMIRQLSAFYQIAPDTKIERKKII